MAAPGESCFGEERLLFFVVSEFGVGKALVLVLVGLLQRPGGKEEVEGFVGEG